MLRPLADRNSKFALLSLGSIYERGITVAPNWEMARSYYERAANEGSVTGYFELGRLLKRKGDLAQARAAFEAGAERGHLPSMSRLGTMMIDGQGGSRDIKAGTIWLEKAAAEGHIFARRKLLIFEKRAAKSIFQKIAVKLKVAALAFEGSKEMSEDPFSDKAR